jgi:hypothetical protein
VCLVARVAQSINAEIPMKLTNKLNVTTGGGGWNGVGGGGWGWECLGKQRSHGMPVVTFAHLLTGEGKIQRSGTNVLLLGLETMARDKKFMNPTFFAWWARYGDWLRAGRSGDRILVGARFSAHVQTGPGVHPASCTMGTGVFPGVKRPGRGADHPPLSSAEVENE